MSKSFRDLDFIRIDNISFAKTPNLPIDIAIMEKTDRGIVVPLNAGWSDVGSWKSLWESESKDNYGNVITNITKNLFKEIGKSRDFTINARTVKLRKIYLSYSQAVDFNLPKEDREEDGKKLALFNTSGHLELAIYKSNPHTVGSASSLFGLYYRDLINIQFE